MIDGKYTVKLLMQNWLCLSTTTLEIAVMPLCICKHGWSAHEDGEQCQLCPCKKYSVAKPPSEQDKQDIVDELHDALKKPDTVLKLKVPADEL